MLLCHLEYHSLLRTREEWRAVRGRAGRHALTDAQSRKRAATAASAQLLHSLHRRRCCAADWMERGGGGGQKPKLHAGQRAAREPRAVRPLEQGLHDAAGGVQVGQRLEEGHHAQGGLRGAHGRRHLAVVQHLSSAGGGAGKRKQGSGRGGQGPGGGGGGGKEWATDVPVGRAPQASRALSRNLSFNSQPISTPLATITTLDPPTM